MNCADASTAAEFTELMNKSGKYPIPLIPDVVWQEITEALSDVLLNNLGDEAEHFYVSRNGYCLLIAALHEIERLRAKGLHRPLPQR